MAKEKEEGAKRGPKRTEAQREADLVVVAEGLKQGRNFLEIAAEITGARKYSITHWQVKKDADTILERWREAYIWEHESMKLLELIKINRIEAQAMAAWERSKEDYKHATKITDSFTPAAKKKEKQSAVSREKLVQRMGGRLPNNQYLQTAAWCVEMRIKLFALIPREMLEGFGSMNGQGQQVGVTLVFKTNKSADELMNHPIKVLTDKEVKEKKVRSTDVVDDSPADDDQD